MRYQPVIGLEIHAELLTDSKVFCTCQNEFGGSENTRVCPRCSGLPGTLPLLNQGAVRLAAKAGFALDCTVNNYSAFDRKNYFYPDLPKAYQITQFDHPICTGGYITVTGGKDIRINHIHIEEDAGKLVHDDYEGISMADYNRCGVPLIEIVTEPDFRSIEEVQDFVEKLALRLKYAGVCDAKMEQGSMRVDVNISIMKPTDTEFGTRAEIKNLNSLKSIVRSIEYEIKRQSKLLDHGERVIQETRRFNDNHGDTKSMRSKEDAHDYRYFPEPDILQVNFTDEDLAEIKAKLPELPEKRLARYISEYGLSEVDAKILVGQKTVSDFFNGAVEVYNNPKSVASFILGELLRRVNLGEVSMDSLPFTSKEFAELVEMADTEKVSKNDAKTVLRLMIETGKSAKVVAEENGFVISNDTGKVTEVVEGILSANEAIVAQYLAGEQKVFGFLMGQCTKELKGVCTPKAIKDTLEAKLNSMK